MWRVREQARLQLESERDGKVKYELLEPERDADDALVADRGLSALPPPSRAISSSTSRATRSRSGRASSTCSASGSNPQGDGLWDDGYQAFWAYDEAEKEFTSGG